MEEIAQQHTHPHLNPKAGGLPEAGPGVLVAAAAAAAVVVVAAADPPPAAGASSETGAA